MLYAIVFDCSDRYGDFTNLWKTFEGSAKDLQQHVDNLKSEGCYNIGVICLGDYDYEYEDEKEDF